MKAMLDRVRTEAGWVEGMPAGNPAYTVFKGIPYARAPVGALRWQPPMPPLPWEGVRRCDAFPPQAMQGRPLYGQFYQREFFPVQEPMSEDCLYLNIWTPVSRYRPAPGTPDGERPTRHPVMMWIHGGAYQNGYAYEMEFDGEGFARRGIVLVTVGYRLGVFGFLAHPELSDRSPEGVSGNYGLLDLIQALRWIRDNIAAFGGDPDNVTIFGQSAGGGAVQALATSPLAHGLFHKAIVQSAGGLARRGSPFTLGEAEAGGREVSRRLGRDIPALMELPPEDLMRLMEAHVSWSDRLRWWRPTVDGWVLPESPDRAIARGMHADVPYVVGSVAGDGALFGGRPVHTKQDLEEALRGQYGPFAPRHLAALDVRTDDDVARAQETRAHMGSLLGPRTWARVHLAQGRDPLYVYHFERNMPGPDHPGAFHSSELWYVFGTIARCWRPLTGWDYDVSRAMQDYWANFATTGNPNGPGLPAWPAFSTRQPLTLRIQDDGIAAHDMGDTPLLAQVESLVMEQLLRIDEA
jgi:para-nitrobenzyl esterase